jgi:rod shape-determining protein MreC
METLLNRYRNITVLLLVIFAQLALLGYQVRGNQDVPMIRVWAVSAVTPVARVLEAFRSGVAGVFTNYVTMKDERAEKERLQREVDRLKIENLFLRTELSTADRLKALTQFQAHTPSKTLAARVIGTGAGSDSKLLFLDRGSLAGVKKGMGVVTPDGIVGRVVAAYPTAAQLVQITDPDFAAGVISQKNRVRGTLRGLGNQRCRVDYVQNEEKVEAGEWFYTSGADRTFPAGFPAGRVTVVRKGVTNKEILLEPAALQHSVEEVLILIEGVHQEIPAPETASKDVYLSPPLPPGQAAALPEEEKAASALTDADRLHERYRAIGEAQNHKFGEGVPGSKPPDFNIKPPPAAGGAEPGTRAPAGQTAPGVLAPPPRAAPPTSNPRPAPYTPPQPALRPR